MLKTKQWIAWGAAFAAITRAYEPQNAEARPRYLKVFNEVYPDRAPPVSCALCHIGNEKRIRTEYGIAVEDALGARNVSDQDTIKIALKNAEAKLPEEIPDTSAEVADRSKGPTLNLRAQWRNWASGMKSIQK